MKMYRVLFVHMRRYGGLIMGGLACMVLYTAFNGVSLLTVIPFFDRVILGNPFVLKTSIPVVPQAWVQGLLDRVNAFDRMQLMRALLAFVFVAVCIKEAAQYGQRVLFEMVGQRVIRDIRNEMFAHIQTLSLDFFGRSRTGELISRLTNDVGLLFYAVSGRFATNVLDISQIVLYAFLVVLFGWKLALMSALLFAGIMVPVTMIGRKVRKLSRQAQKKIGDISSIVKEALHGIRIVKAFTLEEAQMRRFSEATGHYMTSNINIVRKAAMMSPITQIVGTAVASVLLMRGIGDVLAGNMTSGSFIVFVGALLGMIKPAQAMAKLNENLQIAGAALDRIGQIMDLRTNVVEKPGAVCIAGFEKAVELRNVSFSYEAPRLALKNVSLTVRRGEMVAFSGPSGSGKTTLINLVARFYDPTQGAVFIDGRDVRDLNLKSLRGLIGLVSQESILFNDTVWSNITCGRADADPEKVYEAARIAHAHEFVSLLPEGYKTMVGENGVKLSGGEKQRITLARAVFKNPPILILDEATSSLDSQSEKLVQDALGRLIENRTVLVIAHRLSTIRRADRIVVLRKGEVAEIGTHDELLARAGGVYQNLYHLQHQG